MFLWSALYYMPLYFEAAKSLSPKMSGVALFLCAFTTRPAQLLLTSSLRKLADGSLGLGILYRVMIFAIQASSSNMCLLFAAVLYSFFRNFGQMLGFAVGETVFQNQVNKKLFSYLELKQDAVLLSKDASALVEVIRALSVILHGCFKSSMSYYDGSDCAAFFLSVAFTMAKTLERELGTDQGFLYNGRYLS
ncbi:uncharacterized protein BDR25DRAFT_377150 [Lindgomyces ingoldianus]|uniref:Uncharacterized protein n=1 Tax=Lindgomyces ingoldianus TaxID=673940 RepID=A0ACB6QI73_9PLEO|nr:uncharacterized protein BDR25DRAFT_377150 [Lindgomyces ingoldianus]KAF2466577.1 hypothetical protein BDR25DRAFT_377150 [Lindgomyces ingoldianus]